MRQFSTSGTTATYVDTPIIPGRTYNWWVLSTNAGGSNTSVTKSFSCQAAAPTCGLYFDYPSVTVNMVDRLHYQSLNTTVFNANYGVGYLPPDFASTVNYTPTTPGSYIITGTATGAGGTVQCQTFLTVNPAPALAPSCSINYYPSTGTAGQQETVSWSSANANSMTLNGAPVGTSGSAPFTPSSSGTVTYNGGVQGSGGSGSCQGTLTVNPAACAFQNYVSCADSTDRVDNCNNVSPCPSGQTCSGAGNCASACAFQNYVSCADSTHRVDNCNNVSACPSGQTCTGAGTCAPVCTSALWCGNSSCTTGSNGSHVCARDTSCTIIVGGACTYGCTSGVCNAPPTATINFSVTPLLVQHNAHVTVAWSTANISSCTVTGTNGDSWSSVNMTDSTISGATGGACTSTSQCSAGSACLNNVCVAGKNSAPLNDQTMYTIRCTSAIDGSTLTQQATVNMLPTFCEPGTKGCG